jgi:hypothetical protein
MPWEVRIRRADGAPLGDAAIVRQQIESTLPAIQFYRESSGAEKIAAARAAGVEFPDVLRQHLENRPTTERAEYVGDRYTMVLYGFEAQPLCTINVELRGDGNPMPVLAALCRPNGWMAIDDTSRQALDLASDEAAGWEAFRGHRDRAVRSIQASESNEQADL